MSKKKGLIKKCLACDKEFYIPDYRKNTAKFCSHLCQNHKQYDKYHFECEICGKKVITSPSRRSYKKKFCSLDCREAKRASEKEKRTKQRFYHLQRRGNNQGRTIRKHIFASKEKKCEVCGYNEYDFCLDMHHIDGNPQNNELENIKILCVICHRKVHKKILVL